MNRFPQMVFRDGTALPEHGVDYLIVECEGELLNALSDGWREGLEAQQAAPRHPLDHDGDLRPGGSLKGQLSTRAKGAKRKAARAAASLAHVEVAGKQ